MSLYKIILNELNDDAASSSHLTQRDRERIAKKIERDIEEHDSVHLLESCAHMRNVSHLQHRTIAEFAWFVDKVIQSDDPEFRKYQFDWHDDDAIETWIKKFHEYCKEYYSKLAEEEKKRGEAL